MNHWKMADLWNTLMTEALGYPKYAAGGSDYGALVTAQLGHKYAETSTACTSGMDLLPDMFNGDTHWSLGEIPNGAPPGSARTGQVLRDLRLPRGRAHARRPER